MTFGEAIEAMKEDRAVRRTAWHKNERIGIWKGSHDFNAIPDATHVDGVPLSLFTHGHKGTGTRFPYLYGSTRHKHSFHGWAPDAIDMLAEDWEVVEPSESDENDS